MKRFHSHIVYFAAALAVVALWMIAGCSDTQEPAVDDELLTREQTVDFDDPYGGLNFGDEEPAFGDESMALMYGPDTDAEYDDPTEDDRDVGDVVAERRPVKYLMITWGNLEADSTITTSTNWDGSLTIENGAICLKRTIAWDIHDEILPRTARDTLSWLSNTMPHFDGILVALHKIARPDTCNDTTSVSAYDCTPMSVTFDTGPLTVTISEEDLVDLHRVVTVDELGNAVAFNTINVHPGACPSGFLAGEWKPVSHRPGGIFRGKWISMNGLHAGYLRGVYGHSSDGDNVFFGKWINAAGNFKGLLVGYYGAFVDEPGGWFHGIWLKRNLRTGGHLHGIWNTREDTETPGGFFKGRWKATCPNDVTP